MVGGARGQLAHRAQRLAAQELRLRLRQLLVGALCVLVELRIVERQRRLVGERLREPDLVGLEQASGAVAGAERADHAVADHERHHQHRGIAGALDRRSQFRRQRDARVVQEIGRHGRLSRRDREPGDSVPTRQHGVRPERRRGLAGERQPVQTPGFGIEPEERGSLRPQERAHAVRDPPGDDARIEGLGERPSHFAERFGGAPAGLAVGEEAGVPDRHRRLAGEHVDRFALGGRGGHVRGEVDVQDADQRVAGLDRHAVIGPCAEHRARRRDRTGIVRRVEHQQWRASVRDHVRQSDSERQGRNEVRLLEAADGADPIDFRFRVDQPDEAADVGPEREHAGDDLLQHRVQVERAGDRARQVRHPSQTLSATRQLAEVSRVADGDGGQRPECLGERDLGP